MRNLINFRYLLPLLFAFATTMQSCNLNTYVSIRHENDVVKSTQRVKANFFYRNATEKRSPLISINQTIVKETKPNSEVHYTVYDVISLSQNSYALENKVYLIADNFIIPIQFENKTTEESSELRKTNQNILTADSTVVSVVTDYSRSTWKSIKTVYTLDYTAVNRIRMAKELKLRYYAGPDMITIPIRGKTLNKWKNLIDYKWKP